MYLANHATQLTNRYPRSVHAPYTALPRTTTHCPATPCASCMLLTCKIYPPILGDVQVPSGIALIGCHESSASHPATAGPSALLSAGNPTAKHPFRLSPSLPLIPPKLVTKIQSLQFVELRELLPDNMKLLKKLEVMDKSTMATIPPNLRPNLRDVGSLLTWAYCFAQYTAVLAQSHPHLVKSRLAYMCLVIHEGRKSGGAGWAEYDALFRQHAAAAETDQAESPLDWSKVEPSLHSSCLVGHKEADGQLCTLCGSSDHSSQSCALQPLSSQRRTQHTLLPTPSPYGGKSRQRVTSAQTPICIQWNKGECRHESCKYRHSCATCPGQHKAVDCPDTPRDSFYKRGNANRGNPSWPQSNRPGSSSNQS